MANLDVKDKKLLFEIDLDARKTYSELAKILSMSKRGVEYKWKNLEEEKLILNYFPVLDLSKLGYTYFRVLIKFQNLTKELRNHVEDYIRHESEIGWALWAYDSFDLGFTIWAKTAKEFKEIANKFYFQFDSNIKERIESIAIEVKFFKNRFLTDSTSLESFSIFEKGEAIKMDELDRKILKLLVKNPRAKLIDMAGTLKESPQIISYRIKNLKKEKILLGIRPVLNYNLLKKTYYKILIDLNNLSKEKTRDLEEFIFRNSNIVYYVSAIGLSDLDLELIADSPQDLFSFIESIQEKFPGIVRSYRSLIFGETIKANFLPADI